MEISWYRLKNWKVTDKRERWAKSDGLNKTAVCIHTVCVCRLSEMVSVHRVHTHERDDMCSRAEMSGETIEQLTGRTSSLEEQYRFFQEMRGYVRDLVECLNEKVGPQCSPPL